MLTSADGSLRVVFRADARWLQENGKAEMESALARFADIDLVYAHNDPMARGAQLAAEQAGRDGIRFVGIDALPHEGVRYVEEGKLDATFLYPTCGAEAIDVALLLAAGVDVPRDLVLGTRVFTRETLASGGRPVPAPGDAVLAELRTAHAAALRGESLGATLRVGMSQCNSAEPWRAQMNADIRRRVDELAGRVVLDERDAQNDSNVQREQVLELVAAAVDVILVSPKEEVVIVPAAREALANGIPVVVLDRKLGSGDYTVFLGGDNVAIGRAAGEFVKAVLGATGGGNIVEIEGLTTSSPARERHDGFAEALGLRAPAGG
ncbi:MAG: substrate-binding domain-containing protein [Planctomycetes bacterium]|nr:substrate-binding domain-containing protein [Planctomycetota bacterium]